MRAVIIYNSLTGTTRKAAHRIASELKALRFDATPIDIREVTEDDVAGVDLVVVGTWTDGIVVLGQKPAGKRRLHALPSLAGTRAVVFCTYAVDPGRTLSKLVAEVEAKGAEVIGGYAIARHALNQDVAELVDRLTPALVD